MIRVFCGLLIMLVMFAATRSEGAELFTGFQMDNHGQYIGFLGNRSEVYVSSNTHVFVQETLGAFGYDSLDGRNTQVKFFTPSLGVSRVSGAWTYGVHVGPQVRQFREEELSSVYQFGGMGQLEISYQQKDVFLQALGSYATINNFFWGRVRGLKSTYSDVFSGAEISGMGNAGFRAVQLGPVVQVPIGPLFVLFRGGYQHNTTFESGTYGGMEVFFSY